MKSKSTKKHSWTHWAGNGLGAVLILSGLIWTCQKSVFPRIVSASDNTVHNGSVSALSRLAPSRA
ncbi:MAG: hypothetical protein IJG83_02675, partial [Thermoguttaceae bacterium]|nr:hypothetical protein [Thermoguttaceae bacterium]